MWQLPRSPLLACAAVYALIEVVFAIYHLYLSRKIQPPAPGSVLPPDALSDMFLRCLHAGLAVTAPLARTRAYSAPGSWPEVRNGIDAVLAQTKSNGESAGKKVGLGVPSSTNSTTRRRLTRLDSTSLQPYDPDEDVDPLFDTDGRPRVLASDDPRAVEFREQLRTWCVSVVTSLTLGSTTLHGRVSTKRMYCIGLHGRHSLSRWTQFWQMRRRSASSTGRIRCSRRGLVRRSRLARAAQRS